MDVLGRGPLPQHRPAAPGVDGDAAEPAGGTPTAADPTLASGAGSADAATGDRPAAPDDGSSDRCTTAGDPSSRPADSAPDPDSLAADSARCT